MEKINGYWYMVDEPKDLSTREMDIYIERRYKEAGLGLGRALAANILDFSVAVSGWFLPTRRGPLDDVWVIDDGDEAVVAARVASQDT